MIVHDSPYYAVTDERGAFRIDGIPPGTLQGHHVARGLPAPGTGQGRAAAATTSRARSPRTSRSRRGRRRRSTSSSNRRGRACTSTSTFRSTTRTTRTGPSTSRSSSGGAFGARLTGCHVYAARLHDYRFKQMEYTLPEEYKDETELERQRKIHDSLIAMGLQLISESYLDVMKARRRRPAWPSRAKMMDGKHYKALIEDCAGLRLRPGRDGRARHGRGEGQPARLGHRALRAQGRRATR